MDESLQTTDPPSTEAPRLQFGSYRVLHPLGSGGMSSVYRAEHVQTGHEVALKVLPPALAKNPIVLQRFLREAKSAESLEHPNIVSIYDRGVDQGRHYLVLEYVKGTDLHEYVQLRGPLSAAEALGIARQVAEGLRFAAARGLVHRDIKPSNILRSETGEVKITDLGLALHVDFEDERVTREGTTVGTVDYMSPEQARDSRAADLRSDLYSLGCTMYYLLTGIPPFPGGGIVDKLTRHAKSPPPNVRDLRPDVPPALADVMLRMMAKQPEDRYANFDELIAALDAVPIDAGAAVPGVVLLPIEDGGQAEPTRHPLLRLTDFPAPPEARPPSSIPEISLAMLPAELTEDESGGVYHRHPESRPAGEVLTRLREPSARSWSTATWIGLSVAIGLGFLLSIIAIDRVVRSAPRARTTPAERAVEAKAKPEPEPEEAPAVPPAPMLAAAPAPPGRTDRAAAEKSRATPPPPPAPAREAPDPAAAWVEPRDPVSSPASDRPSSYTPETLKTYLPAWALAPVPSRVEGPLIRVRRVSRPNDPATVSTLRNALDETKGTIEIADQGPLLISDFRVPGENRLIRAKDGFRPVIRVERPALAVVRQLPGVVVLEGKSLILDSLDLIVNLRDLPTGQSALFHCDGADLTVRNCTITLVNPGREPFALVRALGASARGSRVRFERTLVRGAFAPAFELGRGNVDVVIRESMILGNQGSIVRSFGRGPGAEHRLSTVGGIFASRGPVIDLGEDRAGENPASGPLKVRAFDTVFGRFQGAGIASVIAAADSSKSPRAVVDWEGQQNLFCGWKGFYASGKDMTLQVPSLAALRSTWNGSDRSSLEIPVAWPQPARPGQAMPSLLAPFIPGREAALALLPEPGPFLEAQTIWSYPEPGVPVPVVLVRSGSPQPAPTRAGRPGLQIASNPGVASDASKAPGLGAGTSPGPGAGATEAGAADVITFDADSPRWRGDLGLFLRETITDRMKRARVRVVGAGPRRSSPVRLPDGLVLELQVEAPPQPDAEWLSWSPAAEAGAGGAGGSAGRALIELHGGTLVLSQLRLQADESAPTDAFLYVRDGDLVLHRCRFTSNARGGASAGALISFVAETTRPRTPSSFDQAIFTRSPDRPVCILGDCTLITEGAAIQARLGRGLIGITQTAIAAGTDALQLLPAEVARGRFDCDLVLEHSTIASQSNIVRLGPWPGAGPGPLRPWLVSTRRCAFLGTYDRRVPETVLLRVDENAMAGGALFWQGTRDAMEVDAFTAVDGETLAGRPRDIVFHWVNFWGGNHMIEETGPRTSSNQPSVRLFERLKPGRIEPAGLILDPEYHPGRAWLDVGADLSRQGVVRRTGQAVRRR